ncbi:hypothetical protein Hypma_003607 [Hypsizygus marmoreus]|uniref:F-box domain-containing protein n=1 Tax=Hypsizygus marmoreus TaxID=39966 RepID=A0A369J921_HYPMA|nr:hypothetical protein Hypma_003607 [Hypsizygus marmoreus]
MIRALAITEILRLILLNFAPLVLETGFDFENDDRSCMWPGELGKKTGGNKFYFAPSDRAALVNAARCNKSFSSVALDILWSVQWSIIPLLRTLPSFIWQNSADRYTLNRMIRIPDWKRFQLYRNRIRHLYMQIDDKIDDLALLQIAQLLKDRPLMPLLHTLSYSLSNIIFLFLSPHLRHLEIVGTTHGRISPLFLQTLSKKVPALVTFSCQEAGLVSRAAWAYLAKFRRLRSIHIANADNLEARELKTILDIKDKSNLSLLIPQGSSLQTSLYATVTVHAYALRTLILSAEPALIADVLSCLVETPIISLRLLYADAYDGHISYENEWRIRLSTISHWSKTLYHLELQDLCREVQLDAEFSENTSILDPFLKMGKLKSLLFRPNVTFSLTDDHLQKYASAWPDLEELSLDFWGRDEEPLATIATLDAFAELCPNLRSLFIRLHMIESTLPGIPRVRTHRLQNLYVDYPAHGHNLATVARYLDALFPLLDVVIGRDIDYPGDEEEDTNHERSFKWGDISAAVKLFQAARADYRMRGYHSL